MPDHKSVGIAVRAIYGIWKTRSVTILQKLWIDFEKKVRDLTDEEQKKMSDELKKFILENDLRREVQWSIKRLKEIRCYRGMRHSMWLPVRWQKTRGNARTAKKLLWRSRVRPVLKK